MDNGHCVMIEGNWEGRFEDIFAVIGYSLISAQKATDWNTARDIQNKLEGRKGRRIYPCKDRLCESMIVECGEWTHIWNGYLLEFYAKEELEMLSKKLNCKIFSYMFGNEFDHFGFTLYDQSKQRDFETFWDDESHSRSIDTDFGQPLAEEKFDLEHFNALETASTFPFLATKQTSDKPMQIYVLEFDATNAFSSEEIENWRKIFQKYSRPWWKFW